MNLAHRTLFYQMLKGSHRVSVSISHPRPNYIVLYQQGNFIADYFPKTASITTGRYSRFHASDQGFGTTFVQLKINVERCD